MPGIAGMVSTLELASLPDTLVRMAETMCVKESFCLRTWTENEAGLAVVGLDADDRLAVLDGITLVFAGQVIADETLLYRLQRIPGGYWERLFATGALKCSMSECLLALYRHLGAAGLQGLNGSYAAAVWDGSDRRLTLVGDRFGLQPMVYWQAGKRLVFSSRAQAVASHPQFTKAVNPVAVFDLLAAEQMLDERTLLADVHSLPPAGLLTYCNGHLDVRSYWKPVLYQPGDAQPDEQAAVDGLADRICTAVDRLVLNMVDQYDTSQPSLCLLLTGGLDSRALAGAIAYRSEQTLLVSNTIGHEKARDVRYGREIARAAGLAHTVLEADPNYLLRFARDCVRRTEGGINVHASWILAEADYLAQAGISRVMDGVGAEAVSGRHWLSDQPVSTRSEALDRLCEVRWTFSRAAKLMRPELRADAEQCTRASLRRTLEEAPADHLLGWADYFAYRQNRRHPTGSILAEDAQVLEPFFDNDLIDYAYRLSPELRAKGGLYKKMIASRFPRLAQIGYTDSGALLIDDLNGRPAQPPLISFARNISKRILRRMARRIPALRFSPYGDNPANAIYYNHWLRNESRPFVSALLAREDLFNDFLDAGQVRKMMADHMDGRQDNFRLICGVLTFALWRELL